MAKTPVVDRSGGDSMSSDENERALRDPPAAVRRRSVGPRLSCDDGRDRSTADPMVAHPPGDWEVPAGDLLAGDVLRLTSPPAL